MATRTQGRGGAAASSKKAAPTQQPHGSKDNHVSEKDKRPISEEEKAERERVNEFTKRIEDSRSKINSLKEQITQKEVQRKVLIKNKTEIQQQLKELSAKRKGILDQRREITKKIDATKQLIETKKADIEKFKDRLPFKNEKSEDFAAKNQAFIDKEIKKFENELQSTAMSLSDEKRVVSELNSWKSLKTAIKDFDVQEEVHKLGDLRGETKGFGAKLDEITAQEDVILKKLQEANDKINESALGIQVLIKQTNAEYAKIEQQIEQRGKVEKELAVARQKRNEEKQRLWKLEQEERERQKKEREEERKKRQQEFLERERKRQEDRDAAEVLKIPYEEELGLCDNLIGFLTELAPAAKKRNAKSDLKIQWEVFLSFEHLSLVPPRSPGDIDKSLEDVKAKKEHYQKLSTEKIEQRKLAKAKEAKETEKSTEEEKPKEKEEHKEEEPKHEAAVTETKEEQHSEPLANHAPEEEKQDETKKEEEENNDN